eukprot:scaffold106109_cov46-Prasinocladus_malaysianus.AAC.1
MQNFLSYRDVPPHLASRVRAYYDFLWERELRREEERWLGGLNSALRTEMVLYMYQDAVSRSHSVSVSSRQPLSWSVFQQFNQSVEWSVGYWWVNVPVRQSDIIDGNSWVPFFNGKHPHFIASLVQNLKPETYAPCDVVSREGEPATCMYFISRGRLEVCLQVTDEVAQDILNGKPVPKGVNGYNTSTAPSDLQKLRSLTKRHLPGTFESFQEDEQNNEDEAEPSVQATLDSDTVHA